MEQLSWKEVQEIFDSKHMTTLDFESVINSFAEGKSYREMLGIPEILMEAFSTIANEYFDNKQYREASDCFFFLATLNPYESEYWLSLGNAEHAIANFEDSLHAYSMAMWTNADDPFPHFYSAEVYYLLDDDKKALRCLEISLLLLDEVPELEEVRPLFEDLKKRICKKENKNRGKK